jgi:hypothetical protein
MEHLTTSQRRGGSGAFILMGQTMVGKFGHGADAQATWLEQHVSPATPRVVKRMSHKGQSGYVMERLEEIDLTTLDHHDILMSMYMQVANNIWTEDPDVTNWATASTASKISNICDKYEFITPVKFNALLTDVMRNRDGLIANLTHGDPTFDNVMMKSWRLVLIDPIPATPAVPDLRSVDTGKMLQSIVGYEALKYGSHSRWVCNADPFTLKTLIDSDLEWAATAMWCCIHLIRCLPYLPVHRHTHLADCVSNALDLI